MDVILAANSESALLNSLEKVNVTDFYSYRIDVNAPNGSKNIIEVSPSIALTSTFPGKVATFKLPRYGIMERLVLETKVVTSGDASSLDEKRIASRIFSDISLRTNNNTICSNSPEYIAARLDCLQADKAPTLNMLSNPSSTLNSGTAYVYTTFFNPFQESQHMFLDLSFVEQLELQCTVNSYAEMGLTGGLTFTEMSTKCFVTYRNLSADVYRAYQAAMWTDPTGAPKKVNMLTYNCYNENSKAITDNALSTTVDLKCPHPVYATHFQIVSPTSNSGPDFSFSNFSLLFSGRTLYNSVPTGVLAFDEAHFGKNSMRCTNLGTGTPSYIATGGAGRIGTIFYGEYPDRTFNSHSLSLSNTNAPQLTVTHADAGAIRHLRVCHEYWQICSIDPADGRITIGNSL